ncbi:MAG: dihydrolipoyl dehydrogenase [Deltaproteobacteria bacterium]|nr:dihydrolipoyl dehydrogenase [Deltaproteobacteria bacterium]
MAENECDLLVVGGGPGGYTAAIRGAQKGLKTVLVEKGSLGGTCLNRGCVPTKSLLQDTGMITAVRTCRFLKGDMKISVQRIAERKGLVVEGSRQWVRNVLSGNGVATMLGKASFNGPKTLKVEATDGSTKEIGASKIVLATGAVEDYGAGLQVDGQNICSTDDALSLKSIPRRLAVVGAGNRGVEFASIYRNLGVSVVLIEKDKRVLPRLHPELADRYKKALLDRKIGVLTRTTVLEAHESPDVGVTLTLEGEKGRHEVQVDKVLLTGHRHPRYEGLGLASAGLSPVDRVVEHDAALETAVEGIYVIGDAAGPPYYAHKAISHALVAVDHILGNKDSHESLFVPNCIYGDPEVATVGLTEEQALKAGRSVRVGEFHFVGNGRAGTMGVDQGLVLMVSDSKTREILGVHIMGPQATELISLATMAMQNGIDLEGIKKTVFAHPTLAETFFEAALATDGEAIHLLVNGERHEPGD